MENPHPDPSDDGLIRYIETTAGQEFTVKAKFLPDFKLEGAPCLFIGIGLGCTEKVWFLHWNSEDLVNEHNMLTKEKSWTFDHVSVKDGEGNWKKAPLTFGALTLSQPSHPVCSQTVLTFPDKELSNDRESIDRLTRQVGRIRVEMFRARKVRMREPFVPDGNSPFVQEEVPEKIFEGKTIQTNIR